MTPLSLTSALIFSLAMSGAFARDYSYMDDHPSSSTRTSSNSSAQSSGLGVVVDSVVGAATEATMDSVFSEEEKSVIRRYYRGGKKSGYDYSYNDDDRYKGKKAKKNKHKYKKKKSLPPGLQKKLARGGELPPGWQKKVQRGEVMETELYQQSRPLPYQLRRKLSNAQYGAQVREVEGKVVKVLEATGVIIDVFDL